MKDKLKNNYLYIIEFFIFFFFSIAKIRNASSGKITNPIYFVLAIIITLSLSVFYFVYFSKKHQLKPEKAFLLIVAIIGPLYLLAFPINTLPDDPTHIVRADEISTGKLTTSIYKNKGVGRYIDKNISKAFNASTYVKEIKMLNLKNSGKKIFFGFFNTALYSFVCYFPQVIGILFAKIFGMGLLLQFTFGRLFNFLTFVLIMYYAIKLIPFKKEVLLLISLLPITLQEAVSMSPDALTIASASFLISYIFYLKNSDKLITKKQIVILTIFSIILSQCKIVYLPICLLLFLIPKNKFGSNKKKLIAVFSILLFVTFLNFLWLSIASKYLPSGGGVVDSARQLKYILKSPFRYLNVMFLTVENFGLDWFLASFGRSLGSFTINVPNLLIIINIFLFIFMSIIGYDKEIVNINIKEKFWLIIVMCMVIGLIFTSLYLQWTSVGNDLISGIQGRYFIPILMLFGILLINKNIRTKNLPTFKYFYLYLALENILVINCIFWYFM